MLFSSIKRNQDCPNMVLFTLKVWRTQYKDLASNQVASLLNCKKPWACQMVLHPLGSLRCKDTVHHQVTRTSAFQVLTFSCLTMLLFSKMIKDFLFTQIVMHSIIKFTRNVKRKSSTGESFRSKSSAKSWMTMRKKKNKRRSKT